jgi:hypothetical protein
MIQGGAQYLESSEFPIARDMDYILEMLPFPLLNEGEL